MARLEKYGEHINDHQREIVSIFSEENYIKEMDDETDLEKLLKEVKKWKPKKYISNTKNFINNLKHPPHYSGRGRPPTDRKIDRKNSQ